jgi:hypothetical protein
MGTGENTTSMNPTTPGFVLANRLGYTTRSGTEVIGVVIEVDIEKIIEHCAL